MTEQECEDLAVAITQGCCQKDTCTLCEPQKSAAARIRQTARWEDFVGFLEIFAPEESSRGADAEWGEWDEEVMRNKLQTIIEMQRRKNWANRKTGVAPS